MLEKFKFFKRKYICNVCSSDHNIIIDEKCFPDFDKKLIPRSLAKKFLKKKNGICLSCGIYQDFNILNEDEIKNINFINKDFLTTNVNFLKYPPSDDYIRKFDKEIFHLRFKRWSQFFLKRKLKFKKVLLLRYFFGASAKFLKAKYNCQIDGMELSNTCIRYVKKMNLLEHKNGNINGLITKLKGKYDAIFCFHILTHSINLKRNLLTLKDMLKPNGFIVFSSDIERKPNNPFHNFHFSEHQLKSILCNYFRNVERIHNCQEGFNNNINPFTLMKDIPDIFVSNKN